MLVKLINPLGTVVASWQEVRYALCVYGTLSQRDTEGECRGGGGGGRPKRDEKAITYSDGIS